jgi:uncharacterized coiled-coil protein SlyX
MPEVKHAPQTKTEKERTNPLWQALWMVLEHLRIQQPETSKETAAVQAKVDDLFENTGDMSGPADHGTLEQRFVDQANEFRDRLKDLERLSSVQAKQIAELEDQYEKIDASLGGITTQISEVSAIAKRLGTTSAEDDEDDEPPATPARPQQTKK